MPHTIKSASRTSKASAPPNVISPAKSWSITHINLSALLSFVHVPSKRDLEKSGAIAQQNMRYPLLEQAALPARKDQAARPVPERVGEPSVFKHVIYIIKENRTYDQVLGDMTEGNGDPSLCVFGEHVTPNLHKVVQRVRAPRQHLLLRHLQRRWPQWADSAMANEYLERSFAGFPRSYRAWDDGWRRGCTGLLRRPVSSGTTCSRTEKRCAITANSPSPKLAGKTQRNREAQLSTDYYQDFIKRAARSKTPAVRQSSPLRPYLVTNTVGWALNIPDVFRADQFIKDLHQFEAERGLSGNLTIICLPNDHTSGTRAGFPTPAAHGRRQ